MITNNYFNYIMKTPNQFESRLDLDPYLLNPDQIKPKTQDQMHLEMVITTFSDLLEVLRQQLQTESGETNPATLELVGKIDPVMSKLADDCLTLRSLPRSQPVEPKVAKPKSQQLTFGGRIQVAA
jgi:hypothetical protein